MSASRFEDLIAWQKARALTVEIYRQTRSPAFRADRSLANQLQRASVSVMSNIAEGFERTNQGDYHRFLIMAKGSCGEIRAQLYIALDVGYISQSKFTALHARASEVSRIIGGLIRSVEADRAKSAKSG